MLAFKKNTELMTIAIETVDSHFPMFMSFGLICKYSLCLHIGTLQKLEILNFSAGFQKTKLRAYDHFHGNNFYGKILTKKE